MSGLTTKLSLITPDIAVDMGDQYLLDEAANLTNIDSVISRGSTAVLASATTSALGKKVADAICVDGAADVAINAALVAGYRVVLLEGTYNCNSPIIPPNYSTLMGQGDGTIVRIKDAKNANLNLIAPADAATGIIVARMKLDGNKAMNGAGTQNGVYCNGGGTGVFDFKLQDVHATSFRNHGFSLLGADRLSIVHCRSVSNNGRGFYLSTIGAMQIMGNIAELNALSGFYMDSYWDISLIAQIMKGNISRGNTQHGYYIYGVYYLLLDANYATYNGYHGIYLTGSNDCSVVGNFALANSRGVNDTYSQIIIDADANDNNVQGNKCKKGPAGNQAKYGLRVNSADCDDNLVTNNDVKGSAVTAAFSDAGTGTITAAGNRV